MKLDDGQSITPVPWPIQSSPTTSARKPTIKSNMRMGHFPVPDCWRGSAARVARALAQSKSSDDEVRAEQCRCQSEPQKAPDDAGAFPVAEL
jgi:hypothetical protein